MNEKYLWYRLDELRFPRTLHGWRKLFWIALGACPTHWAMLRNDSPWDAIAFCFSCEGIGIYPNGFMIALQMNARAYRTEQNDKAAILAAKGE